jgi:hypothetical protein
VRSKRNVERPGDPASPGRTPLVPIWEGYLRELGVSELLPRNGDLAAAARERHPTALTLSSTW